MASLSTDNLIEKIKNVNFNPNEIMRLFLKATEELTNGEMSFFTADNPTVVAVEAGVITPAAILQEIQLLTRDFYAPAVDSWEGLFLHMQDEDYAAMTNQPGGATVTFILSVDEIKRKAIALENNPDVKVIEFPAHTQIVVGDYSLMFKLPFSIRINKYGNISIKYNLDNDPFLGRIRNAVINYEYTRLDGMEVIKIPIECVQVALTSQVIAVSPTTGFKQRIVIKDKFYKLKAYTRFDNSTEWVEIDTTRRLRVLNKNRTTLQIQASDNELVVSIPSFYFNNRMIGNNIRLDIYTTHGSIEHPLINYNDGAYQIKYFDYNNKNNQYAGLLGSLNVLKAFSTDTILGGSDALSFDEMKKRVVNRSTITEGIPITELEIENKLADLGFSTVKVKDNVTERLFAASRLLPAPDKGTTVTGIGCNVQSYQTTINELAQLSTVRSNGTRLTVLPTTLYNVNNGVLEVVDAALVDQLMDSNVTAPENLAAWANAINLVFSPYHYVHDIANNEYVVRAYRLDNPKVESKVTINENPTMQLDAGVYSYELITKTDGSGYSLYLGLSIGENFKELDPNNVSVQIAYLDETGENRYFLNGTLVMPIDPTTGRPQDDNYIYRFDFDTNWDIDENHRLILKSGYLPLPLDVELDIFIVVKDFMPAGFAKTEMDNIISLITLPNYDGRSSQNALIQERLKVSFGKHMQNLWARARTTIDASDVKRYEQNVPAVYLENVYARDRNNVIEMEYNSDTKMLEAKILHPKGDAIFDEESGLPIYIHKIGDIVMEHGQPVYKEGLRGLKRQFDLVVMDGLYYMTTHEATISYVRAVLDVIDSWVFDLIGEQIKPELLERTSILYHPKSTVGLIEVFVGSGIKVLVKSDQSLFIRFFVDKSVYGNTDLRNNMEVTAKKVIQQVLESKSTISHDDLTKALRDVLGENLLGVELKGFMEDKYNTITVANALTTPSIGKRLSVNSKLELIVEDNVEFDFVWHGRDESL